MCACSERVRAPRRCARPAIARRRLAVLIARPSPRVGRARICLFARVGRRCHVEMPHGQRAVGWPRRAHVRGRRRRRHLRHRRLRLLQRNLLQRRVGEHRRRCAAGLSPREVGGVLDGYSGGTTGGRYSRGSLGIPTGFAPGRPPRARISDHSPVPLSLRCSTCKCSRRCYCMYGVHVSRQELCAC